MGKYRALLVVRWTQGTTLNGDWGWRERQGGPALHKKRAEKASGRGGSVRNGVWWEQKELLQGTQQEEPHRRRLGSEQSSQTPVHFLLHSDREIGKQSARECPSAVTACFKWPAARLGEGREAKERIKKKGQETRGCRGERVDKF